MPVFESLQIRQSRPSPYMYANEGLLPTPIVHARRRTPRLVQKPTCPGNLPTPMRDRLLETSSWRDAETCVLTLRFRFKLGYTFMPANPASFWPRRYSFQILILRTSGVCVEAKKTLPKQQIKCRLQLQLRQVIHCFVTLAKSVRFGFWSELSFPLRRTQCRLGNSLTFNTISSHSASWEPDARFAQLTVAERFSKKIEIDEVGRWEMINSLTSRLFVCFMMTRHVTKRGAWWIYSTFLDLSQFFRKST